MDLFKTERRIFPDPREAAADGLVEVWDHINTEILLEAYSFGIYPWPFEGLPILWFSPPERGVLDFDGLRVPRSFKKFLKTTPLELRINTAFAQVIAKCSEQPRPGQAGTWITPKMRRAYVQFYRDGYAHSIEAWLKGRLVGGLYGVHVGGVFAGESMFFEVPNASKFCLFHLTEILRAQGHQWMDIQMVTPLTKQWGGKYISRDDFLKRLEVSHREARSIDWEIRSRF